MSFKNLIIAALLMSNAATLFVIYQYRDGFVLSHQLKRAHAREGSDEEERERESKDYILHYYADALATCGAAVTVGPVSSLVGTSEWDMACLIAGKRDVIWVDLEDVAESLLRQIAAFKSAVKAEHIRQLGKISFRPEGERKALLFAKHRLNELVHYAYNSYLTGLLLGYDPRDIEFFEQRGGFFDRMNDNEMPPFHYAKFSDDLKREFQDYLKTEWITLGRRDRLEQNKQNAFKWLAEQEVYSIDELYQQIAELKKEIA